jgi:hypothetical protein
MLKERSEQEKLEIERQFGLKNAWGIGGEKMSGPYVSRCMGCFS